ncbi:uncharacterized protein LOC121738926 [Aricia agestis]|uniref:uncharacterized protein LOC121738926 n=1 Tax=Aricia agestis TaxID=91739 RepID=UPI001C205E45|nr:uncharacterized protein LOC121738926 [Aricia agestis]
MDNQATAATAIGVRREPSTDPVKAQGILASVTKKERDAARLWHQRWGFLCHKKEEEEKEALELGLSVDEYRAAIRLLRRSSEDRKCPVPVEACKDSLPSTSSGMVGRRVLYPLEKFGPLVKTSKNYPTRPPLPPGQVYDPYKQTMVFLGSVEGDPISHKQSPARCETTDMWAELPLAVSHFDTLHFGAK